MLRKRFSFKNSNQRVLRQMWSESSKDHVRMDAIASKSDKISTATTILRNQQMAGKEAHFLGLKMQGESSKVIIESITRKNLTSWNNLAEHLPQFLFQFARKALQQQLPTASNLYRWKKLQSPMCTLCGMNRPQTNLHVLSNCSSQKALGSLHAATQLHLVDRCSLDRFFETRECRALRGPAVCVIRFD